MKEVANAFTVDLEPWYTAELLNGYLTEEQDDQIEEAVWPILDLLDKYRTKATFFVLGIVAEKHPEVIRLIYDKGHEIVSHAYSHKTLTELGVEGFEYEVKQSVSLLESITREKPIGFRAPSFSMDNSTRWALKILKDNGFKYDSSIFPIKTVLYGVPEAPLHPYRLSADNLTESDPAGDIIEFPLTVFRFGRNIPVAGGFYLRLLPLWFLRLAIKKVNMTRPAIIYIHPWETYPKTPRITKASLFSRFVTYYGINSALRKVEGLLELFEFRPLRELLNEV